jgi:hypothetical protein
MAARRWILEQRVHEPRRRRNVPDLPSSFPAGRGSPSVQFYVEGIDALGVKILFSRRTAPIHERFSNSTTASPPPTACTTFAWLPLTADADQLFRTVNLMSNERIGCTMILR